MPPPKATWTGREAGLAVSDETEGVGEAIAAVVTGAVVDVGADSCADCSPLDRGGWDVIRESTTGVFAGVSTGAGLVWMAIIEGSCKAGVPEDASNAGSPALNGTCDMG